MKPKKKSFTDYIFPILILVFTIFLALHMAMSYETVKVNPINKDYINSQGVLVEKRVFDYIAFGTDLFNHISEKPNDIHWVDSSLKFVGALLFVYALYYLNLLSNRKKYITGKEYGDAEWGKSSDLQRLLSYKNILKRKIRLYQFLFFLPKFKESKTKEVKEKYTPESQVILTKSESVCRYNNEINNNTLIIGGSGSRKTRGYVIPFLLQLTNSKYSPSVIVSDPKGEIVEAVGYYLTAIARYDLKVLNLKEFDKSAGYNPFVYIMEDEYEEQISTLVHKIIKSRKEKDEQKANDPFWDNMAEMLLSSIFYAVYMSFPKSEQNIPTCLKLFRWFKVDDDDNEDTKLDDFFEVFAHDKYIMEKYGDENENPALRTWIDFRGKVKGKTAQSVVATALEKVKPFDMAKIRRIFEKDELSLDKIGEQRTALFIVLAPTKTNFNFIANLMYTQLFEQLEYCATVKHHGKLPVNVQFIIDEYFNIGKIPSIENMLSYARSFGIGITPIIQSLDQLKELHEKSWGTVLDNCSTFLYLGRIRNTETLKMIQELIGKGTFDKKSYSVTKGKQGSTQTTYDKVGTELISISGLQTMPNDDCILFVTGYRPFYSKKYDYSNHPNYIYTYEKNKQCKYSYIPSYLRVNADLEKENDTHREIKYSPLVELNTDIKSLLNRINTNLELFDIENNETSDIVFSDNDIENCNIIANVLKEDTQSKISLSEIKKSFRKEINLQTPKEVIATINALQESVKDSDIHIVNNTSEDKEIEIETEDETEQELYEMSEEENNDLDNGQFEKSLDDFSEYDIESAIENVDINLGNEDGDN